MAHEPSCRGQTNIEQKHRESAIGCTAAPQVDAAGSTDKNLTVCGAAPLAKEAVGALSK